MECARFQDAFFARLDQPHWAGELFDAVADTVYFVKDGEGRYVAVNDTLVRRCGVAGKDCLVGKRAEEVFPGSLGEDFTRQDFALLAGGPDVSSQLELHLYPGGASGWCLTWKKALRNAEGDVIGLTGISRDLATTPEGDEEWAELSRVVSYIRDHLDEPLTLETLASAAGLSSFQIGQRFKRLFGLSTHQYIMRSRIESARHLLSATNKPLSEIALASGFSDQSSFTRQFKKAVGMTPRAYRGQ